MTSYCCMDTHFPELGVSHSNLPMTNHKKLVNIRKVLKLMKTKQYSFAIMGTCNSLTQFNEQWNAVKLIPPPLDHENLVVLMGAWRSGESTHLPPMCPGFDSHTQHHKRAEFVGSLLCSERFFPWVLQFSTLPKNQHLI